MNQNKRKHLNWKRVCLICVFTGGSILILAMSWHYLGKKGVINALIPVFFGNITAFFSYMAYFYTKEKFRLELLNKRLEIYQNLASFLSLAAGVGTLAAQKNNKDTITEFHKRANMAFRGNGYHKAKLLFDDDIQDILKKTNEIYAFLTANPEIHEKKQAAEWKKQVGLASKMLANLPNFFKKYIYFGNYKSN